MLGWVWWVMSLSYGDMLKGIPGTGTRDGGLKGSMLTVNLDHIVLLRFNALCLRISVMAMLVYLVINLPIYFYAQCSDVPRGYIDALHQNCTVDANYTVTSYSRYTLANVPQLSKQYHGTEHSVLYVVVITSYFVLWIVLYELYHEWIDCLSMRRVYYLEMDMWKQRQKELKETMLLSGDKMRLDTDDDNPHLHNREVYIPHPEQRDTPPNVGTYRQKDCCCIELSVHLCSLVILLVLVIPLNFNRTLLCLSQRRSIKTTRCNTIRRSGIECGQEYPP